MKTTEEFRDFFENNLKPRIPDFDNVYSILNETSLSQRTEHKFILLVTLIILVPMSLFLISSLLERIFGFRLLSSITKSESFGLLYSMPYMFLFIALVIIGNMINKRQRKSESIKESYNYRTSKKFIVEEIINFCCSNGCYSPNSYFPSDVMKESRLGDVIPGFTARCNCEAGTSDLFEGRVGESPFSLSILSYDLNSKIQEAFLECNFNKNFSGSTYIFEKSLLGSGLIGVNKELVELEDPVFEKSFYVRTDNQITARYILTTSFMQKLLKLKASINGYITIAFTNSRIYIYISQAKIGINGLDLNVLKFEHANNLFEQLQLIVEIIDELNLNQKIC